MRLAIRGAGSEYTWTQVAALRFSIGTVVIALWAMATGQHLRIVHARQTWLRCTFGVLSAFGTFYALGRPDIAVGDIAALGAVAPLVVGALSYPLIRERVAWPTQVALVTGFVGTLRIVRPAFATAASAASAALMGAALYAVAMLFLRVASRTETPVAVAVRVSASAAIVFAIVALSRWSPLATHDWPGFLAAGVLGGVGQIAMTRGLAVESAARAMVIPFLGMALSYLGEAICLARSPSADQTVGIAVTCVAVAIASFRAPKERTPSLAAPAVDCRHYGTSLPSTQNGEFMAKDHDFQLFDVVGRTRKAASSRSRQSTT